ncbi:MAG: 5-amino-6-(D-ribitylamino)uracil--L-tyrosine 4-hydroxyphenyl transferase CofH [Steroidobacteraceae bacterium]
MSDDAARIDRLIGRALEGESLDDAAAFCLEQAPLALLQPAASSLALAGHGPLITWSPKVFLPLTRLCRDVCHYCTFATAPRHLQRPYLSPEEVLMVSRAGATAGCTEALFTLGDKPELRYPAARDALAAMGFGSTLEYLLHVAGRVVEETGLLPHLNAGVMNEAELAALRPVAASMGLMLESSSERLCQRGGPHFGSPDKHPAARLDTLRAAGRLGIPFTTGLLVGIGETRRERIESLLALRALHRQYGHLQDLIIQNFKAKPGTRMAGAPEPDLDELLWTIAVARLLFGSAASIQAPPNLSPSALARLAASGINDWGGVSPVTPDHVNPEAPWPEVEVLRKASAQAGRWLVARLPITPAYAREAAAWLPPAMASRVLRAADATGMARTDRWFAGLDTPPPERQRDAGSAPSPSIRGLLQGLRRAVIPDEAGIATLLEARDVDEEAVVREADLLRQEVVGDRVSYAINRNINYTNVCLYACGFCAFSKGRPSGAGREPGYLLDPAQVAQRAVEAWSLGATEVCLQGGIHPAFTGDTYLDILAAVHEAAPGLHVHAFSPLEVTHGAATLGLDLAVYLDRLRQAGLSSLPGTAAEILDDDVRRVICPDKLDSHQWLEVMRTAHEVGLRSTATMMFGHVDRPIHWARHLLRVRALQAETGGFTEFVPLPFVHPEAPLWRRGLARSGPTFREARLVHAVARLVLHPVFTHIQASWVKMGLAGMGQCLAAGADDMGGVLMNESITRAAGGSHGQRQEVPELLGVAAGLGRVAWQRTTLYQPVRHLPRRDSCKQIQGPSSASSAAPATSVEPLPSAGPRQVIGSCWVPGTPDGQPRPPPT